MALPKGFHAPDFRLDSTHGCVTLSDLRGKNVVLTFYPGDWTPVCSGQLDIYNALVDTLHELNAVVLGISVDSVASHQAWSEKKNLQFPLLADFEPKGEVARRYDVFNITTGTTNRAVFVIDKNGRIQWSYTSPYQENPGANGIIAALERIEGKETTCVPWPQLSPAVDDDDNIRGEGVTVVEYGDLQCPDCRAVHDVLQQLPVRLVYRHFPLPSHEYAFIAAEATEAAAAQGKFWEMHDAIYENQELLDEEYLAELAEELGLDVNQFLDDLTAGTYHEVVKEDFLSGARSGVIGTPTLFIDGGRYEGEVTREALEQEITKRSGIPSREKAEA